MSEPPPAVNAETLATLSSLHANLGETADEIVRELERTAERAARQLWETPEESARHSDAQAGDGWGRPRA